ncbi:hypothetical protein [Desulfonatronovibrio hydrogenovorans]|uniref:hypothetical protein n=1 Tax=Desulfonatronovibrio hydrogenovorans TaxID=53245 RepID=UPI00048F819D|nr:hypothetical protein [Desulfonatronovibrio hydrogenovorans]
MSKSWVKSKLPEFVRDVLRDFCLVSQHLFSEFSRYEQTGQISFTFFKDLLGEEMNKGQLWRLKDTSHILFRSEAQPDRVGLYLDWCIGYIFHECMKLREDAYQQENYRPWFEMMHSQPALPPEEKLISKELFTVLEQTNESIEREVSRIKFILFHCRRLFAMFLPAHQDNPLLARFLFAQESLVREVFKSSYKELIQAIYPGQSQKMYTLAAQSLEQGGWNKEAAQARKRV